MLLATGEAELRRLLAELAVALEATTSLEELLVVGITRSVAAIRNHEALQYLIDHEPGEVLAHVSFDALDPLLAVATAFGQPYLSRYLDPATAAATAEWMTRVIVSYGIVPVPRPGRSRGGHPLRADLRAPRAGPGLAHPLRRLTGPRPTRPPARPPPAPPDLIPRSPTMSSNEALIGRSDVNDIEAILSVSNTDVDELVHTVSDNADAIFTWDYEKGARPALNKLYEKAKTSQWNGETDLPWDTDVDQEAVVMANAAANPQRHGPGPGRHLLREVGGEGLGAAGHRVAELGAEPVHAR